MKDNWKYVSINPTSESLKKVAGPRIIPKSIYHALGYSGTTEDIWLRKDAANRLIKAAALLPLGMELKVLDGWRSFELQLELYNEVKQRIEDNGFEGDLEAEISKFVSYPSIDENNPFPHATGGSVDLTLSFEGQEVDMGSSFDETTSRSKTNFYQGHNDSKYKKFNNNRNLLIAVMTHVGFSNYAEEWWHFDLGNQFHHSRVGGIARYGATSLDNIMSKEELAFERSIGIQ